jgi:hypothetical protein
MNFSYSAVWNDAVAMIKRHGALLAAIAGVFIFLPILLTGYLLPAPTSETDPLGVLTTYYRENWIWLLLGTIVNALGAIAIYRLLFAGSRVTVGQAIGGALALLPGYVAMSIIVSLALGVGFLALVIPAIYLLGRLTTAAPAMVAENRANPIAAIAASWRLSAGKGWAVAGLILVVAVAGVIVAFVVTALVGLVVVLAVGRDGIGELVLLLVGAAANSALYVVLIVLIAAIYRALRGETTPQVDLTKGI